jgi:hypothetical protein
LTNGKINNGKYSQSASIGAQFANTDRVLKTEKQMDPQVAMNIVFELFQSHEPLQQSVAFLTFDRVFLMQINKLQMNAFLYQRRIGIVVFGQFEQQFPNKHSISGWILAVACQNVHQFRVDIFVAQQLLSTFAHDFLVGQLLLLLEFVGQTRAVSQSSCCQVDKLSCRLID